MTEQDGKMPTMMLHNGAHCPRARNIQEIGETSYPFFLDIKDEWLVVSGYFVESKLNLVR